MLREKRPNALPRAVEPHRNASRTAAEPAGAAAALPLRLINAPRWRAGGVLRAWPMGAHHAKHAANRDRGRVGLGAYTTNRGFPCAVSCGRSVAGVDWPGGAALGQSYPRGGLTDTANVVFFQRPTRQRPTLRPVVAATVAAVSSFKDKLHMGTPGSTASGSTGDVNRGPCCRGNRCFRSRRPQAPVTDGADIKYGG